MVQESSAVSFLAMGAAITYGGKTHYLQEKSTQPHFYRLHEARVFDEITLHHYYFLVDYFLGPQRHERCRLNVTLCTGVCHALRTKVIDECEFCESDLLLDTLSAEGASLVIEAGMGYRLRASRGTTLLIVSEGLGGGETVPLPWLAKYHHCI